MAQKTPIIVFYHCALEFGSPPQIIPSALSIIFEQVSQWSSSGLVDECQELVVGCNGGPRSASALKPLLPSKASMVMHGLDSRAENLTIMLIEERVKTLSRNHNILYHHSKGVSHRASSDYGNNVSAPWRRAMMDDLVINWRECVNKLDDGNDVVCSHWLWNMADGTQHIPAGNFLWLKSDFAKRIPSMYLRDRIKVSGISSAESRYEAEVYWGNGPKPTVHQIRPNGGGGIP